MKKNQIKSEVKIEDMSLYQLCRWSALIDCMELAEEKCKEKRIEYDTLDVNHLDIVKYVDAITDDIYYKALNTK